MGGTIHAYYDVVSPYSYFAYVHLQRLTHVLASHNVSVEIHPVFLGGIMKGSGNKPPITLPAKAKFSPIELARGCRYFNMEPFTPPKFFPILTILPMRALTYIKHAYPQAQFEAIFGVLYRAFFSQHEDISKPDVLRKCMLEAAEAGLSAEQVEDIMTNAQQNSQWKNELAQRTQEALDKGAFGAPFFWVVRTKDSKVAGKEAVVEEEAPFWGSDRFYHMWEFLGLPWEDVKLHPSEAKL